MIKRLLNDLKLLPKSALFTYRLRQDLRASNGDFVLVYQMAKVGSLSVYESLQDGLKIPVYHTHFLSAVGIQNAERFFRNAGAATPSNIRYSAILRRHLSDMRPVIITLIRDPIAREISNYFQIGDRVFDALKGIDGSGGGLRLYSAKYLRGFKGWGTKLQVAWFIRGLTASSNLFLALMCIHGPLILKKVTL